MLQGRHIRRKPASRGPISLSLPLHIPSDSRPHHISFFLETTQASPAGVSYYPGTYRTCFSQPASPHCTMEQAQKVGFPHWASQSGWLGPLVRQHARALLLALPSRANHLHQRVAPVPECEKDATISPSPFLSLQLAVRVLSLCFPLVFLLSAVLSLSTTLVCWLSPAVLLIIYTHISPFVVHLLLLDRQKFLSPPSPTNPTLPLFRALILKSARASMPGVSQTTRS